MEQKKLCYGNYDKDNEACNTCATVLFCERKTLFEPAVEKTGTTSRSDILEAARRCVCGQREQDYGSPEDNFKRISELWKAYLGVDISSKDVAVMMILMKVARAHGEKCTEDTLIDIAGYAACAGEIVASQK